MIITVLGMGAMGSRIADRLELVGHDVRRWSRSIGQGSARDAVAGAEIVIAMIRDDDAVRAVWLDPEHGALAGLEPGSLAIESSTLSPGFVTTLADAFAAAGQALLEAPVLGSRPQAEAGALIHLAGGPEQLLDRARPVLAALGTKQLHIGGYGAAARFKLACNALLAVQVATLAELTGALAGAGFAVADARALLAETPLLSPAGAAALTLMAAGRDEPLFAIELVAKDLAYAIDAAQMAMPLTQAAAGVFEGAIEDGLGSANITAVRRRFSGQV